MNQVFEPKRLWLLVRKDLVSDWRSDAVACLALFLAMFLMSVLGALFGEPDSGKYYGFFTGCLLIWGTIGASLSFKELHDKSQNEDFLMLPASSLEKTAARLLSSVIVLPLLILVLVTLSSLLIEGFTALVFHRSGPVFNPFAGNVWRLLGHFVILDAVFFLGAAWFRKAHWIKTVLSVGLIALFAGFLATVVFRIAFAGFFEGFFSPVEMDFACGPGGWGMIETRWPNLLRTLAVIGKTIYFALIAPFCWVVAWLRVKETQVSHGV